MTITIEVILEIFFLFHLPVSVSEKPAVSTKMTSALYCDVTTSFSLMPRAVSGSSSTPVSAAVLFDI